MAPILKQNQVHQKLLTDLNNNISLLYYQISGDSSRLHAQLVHDSTQMKSTLSTLVASNNENASALQNSIRTSSEILGQALLRLSETSQSESNTIHKALTSNIDLISMLGFQMTKQNNDDTFRFIFVWQSYDILHTNFSILHRNLKKQTPYIVYPTALQNDDVNTTAGIHITTNSIVVLRLHCFIHDTNATS